MCNHTGNITNFSPVRYTEVGEIAPTKVTQSNTISHNDSSLVAANAVDYNFLTLSGAGTDNGNQPVWLKLEFDKTYFIHKVIIYYRFYTNWYDPDKYWCTQNEDAYKTCVDRHNNADVSVYQGDVQAKSCGTLKLTYGLKQSDQIYKLLCNTKGDTVKLSKNSEKIFVTEVAVTTKGMLSHMNHFIN